MALRHAPVEVHHETVDPRSCGPISRCRIWQLAWPIVTWEARRVFTTLTGLSLSENAAQDAPRQDLTVPVREIRDGERADEVAAVDGNRELSLGC